MNVQFIDTLSVSQIWDKDIWHSLYFGLVVAAFGSFWYSSLKIFSNNPSVQKNHRILFKILVTLTWWISLYEILAVPRINFAALGLTLVIAALWLFWQSARHIREAQFAVIFDSQKPHLHISSGPYRWIRHPFYASYIYVYLSLIITTTSWLLDLLCVTVIAYYWFAARQEEKKFINSDFETQYKNYKNSAGMFFPKFSALLKV